MSEPQDKNIVQKAVGAVGAVAHGTVAVAKAGAGANAYGTNVDHQVETTEINKVVDASAGVNSHGTNVDHKMKNIHTIMSNDQHHKSPEKKNQEREILKDMHQDLDDGMREEGSFDNVLRICGRGNLHGK
eukprot:CAMPEP_0172458474 /NCGR_PEP_ID=MMETSP1065-20121228/27688_1 /TAXON_ID=265537 /ORGANISM="Amphiprora paludosa, Strain CCMP125" /LENGTH=129 /DNA_ID=CAMNT_0013212743 /DNA_START=64 /DNA_END=451 /DNA_ORIENTATION=-